MSSKKDKNTAEVGKGKQKKVKDQVKEKETPEEKADKPAKDKGQGGDESHDSASEPKNKTQEKSKTDKKVESSSDGAESDEPKGKGKEKSDKSKDKPKDKSKADDKKEGDKPKEEDDKSKDKSKGDDKAKDEGKKDDKAKGDAKKTATPKRPPFDKEKFYAEEEKLDVDSRRSRYSCSRYYSLDEIPAWNDYYEGLVDPISQDEDRKAIKIAQLKDLFEENDKKAMSYMQKKIADEEKAAARRKEREEHKKFLAEKKQAKKAKDSDDETEEDEEDSDEESSDSLETQKKKLAAWMGPPEPEEGDLVTSEDDTKATYKPNEDINAKVSLYQGDITTLEIDAIVNAANEDCKGGGGIDGAIHNAAGPTLFDECVLLKGCPTGQTKVTRGHNLPSRWVFHTVGPMVRNEKHPLPKTKLLGCYQTCLKLIDEFKIRTIAFCAISTGIFGYSIDMATHIALKTVREWLEVEENRNKVDRIIFCVFGDKDRDCYEDMMQLYFPPVPQPSTTIFPSAIPDKWELFSKTFGEGTAFTKVEQLAEAITTVSGNPSLDLSGLLAYFNESVDSKERSAFCKKLLPKIAELALRLPKVFAAVSKDKKKTESKAKLMKVNLLIQGVEDTLKFTQEQAASLLACAFFGVLPTQQFHSQKFSNPNFVDLFAAPGQTSAPPAGAAAAAATTSTAEAAEEQADGGEGKKKKKKPKTDEAPAQDDSAKRSQFAKIKSILHYFQRVLDQLPNENELLVRRKVYIEPNLNWKKIETFVERFVDVKETGKPLHTLNANEIQLVAINKLAGSDVLDAKTKLGRSDLRFFQSPELLLLRLFASTLLPTEALEVRGAETFSILELDEGNALKFVDNFEDKTPTDLGVRRVRLLCIDPLVESSKDALLRAHNIVRELDRIYTALYEDLEDLAPAPAAAPAAAAAAAGATTPRKDAGKDGKTPEKPKRKKEEGMEIKRKQPPFIVATDDWGCDAHFGGDPWIKAFIVHLAVSRYNLVAYDVDPKWLAKHGPTPRPEVHFANSRASTDLIATAAIYHREEVAPYYVVDRIFKELQQGYSSDNLCVRIATMFESWREDLKAIMKARDKARREEQKRIDHLMAEQHKMAKKYAKEREKLLKAATSPAKPADGDKGKAATSPDKDKGEKKKEEGDKKKEEKAGDSKPADKPKDKAK